MERASQLNVKEAAELLGVHENTVRNWARNGTLDSARIAGSNVLRFDRAAVERLVRARGADVAPVSSERRFVGPDLIRAVQLEQWADFLEARGLLPEMLRRLLIATPGVSGVAVRTREGTDLGGWDGQAHSLGGPHLPTGSLRFEIGANKHPKAKAEKDYRARVGEAGDQTSQEVFIFVTPRRWPGGESWAAERRAEGVFADVIALDADRLEAWLQSTPSAHHWISEELGGVPDGAVTLERWWTRFSGQTKPALPARFFLAGRKAQVTKLIELLDGAEPVVTCRARTRDEALAFVAAALGADAGSPNAANCMVVTDPKAWQRLVWQSGRVVLIPTFASPDIGQALERGHAIVLVSSEDEVAAGEILGLGKIDRSEAAESLVADAGIPFDRAQRHASQARRSVGAFMRDLARDPRRAKPAWAAAGSGVPCVMALVGGWDDTNETDRAAVAQIAGTPFDEVERVLRQWKDTADPPFVLTGDEWHVASADEAFLVLRGGITSAERERWKHAALDVLLERNPALDLPVEERYLAGVRGATRKNSGVLRKALAEGLALVGATEAVGSPLADAAADVVRLALREAEQDHSGAVWASLADVLPLLAEAAPDDFLDAVLDDLDKPVPILRALFQDATSGAGMFYSSPHTGLLWALETLSWHRDHMAPATLALARLAAVDPGGRLSNRPKNSLAMILVTWVHQTSATTEDKVTAVKAIARTAPAPAFELLLELWPSRHATVTTPHRPRFADWDPDVREVSLVERARYVEAIVELAIELASASASADKWKELVERLTSVTPELRGRVLDQLKGDLVGGALDVNQRLELWECVRATAARSRQHEAAPWALDDATLERLDELIALLDDSEAPERWAYLFDWMPEIPEISPGAGYEDSRQVADELRERAVRNVLGTSGPAGLRRLAERVAHAQSLGFAIAEVTGDDLADTLLSWMDASGSGAEQAVLWWVRSRVHTAPEGAEWFGALIRREVVAGNARARVLIARNVPTTRPYWEAIRGVGGDELWNSYWEEVEPYNVPLSDLSVAVDELLSRGRPWFAVHLLALTTADEDAALPPELVQRVLAAALGAEIGPGADQNSAGFHVGRLLDQLDSAGVALETLAGFEYAFFGLLEHAREPRALYLALAADAGLFVRLVQIVYRSKNENTAPPSEDDIRMAPHAWSVLHAWDGPIPGQGEGGPVELDALMAWVTTARYALQESGHADVGDEQIGEVLAAGPEGSDGVWPAEAVRAVIEAVGSSGIETGLYIGVANRRGITSRGVYEGGDQERELAAKYGAWARALAMSARRTSRVLRRLAERYEREASEHDADADARGDTE